MLYLVQLTRLAMWPRNELAAEFIRLGGPHGRNLASSCVHAHARYSPTKGEPQCEARKARPSAVRALSHPLRSARRPPARSRARALATVPERCVLPAMVDSDLSKCRHRLCSQPGADSDGVATRTTRQSPPDTIGGPGVGYSIIVPLGIRSVMAPHVRLVPEGAGISGSGSVTR